MGATFPCVFTQDAVSIDGITPWLAMVAGQCTGETAGTASALPKQVTDLPAMHNLTFKNRSPRMLIVDDSPVNTRFLWTILQESGCKILMANDGGQAIEMANRELPDLILMDVNMPGMNGFEVCRTLKGQPNLQGTPIIFLTARNDKEDIVRGFEAGAVDYVVKPFHINELLARVSTQLELKQLRDDLAEAVAALQTRNEHLQSSLDRIARLEHAMLKICAWTKQVNVDGEWISIEDYLGNYLGLVLTHGLSESAKAKLESEASGTDPLKNATQSQ
jgi:DNA-binding response OmpR family regulator